jgi:hypothetical protein
MTGNINPSQLEPLTFDAWVPEAARVKLTELFDADNTRDVVPGLLERLATYPVMKSEVWEKLPSELKESEGSIIEWAYLARALFPFFTFPHARTRADQLEWVRQIRRYPPLSSPKNAAGLAWLLRNEILELKTLTDSWWSRLWPGESSLTPDRVLTILEQLQVFYDRMNREFAATFDGLPKVKHWRGARAAQIFFTEYLSARMTEACGKPLDSIVAALTEVAFDLPEGVAAETIRGRRRLSTPEKSNRKPR